MPCYNRDPKRDHNFDNHPYDHIKPCGASCLMCHLMCRGLGFRGLGLKKGVRGVQDLCFRVIAVEGFWSQTWVFEVPET